MRADVRTDRRTDGQTDRHDEANSRFCCWYWYLQLIFAFLNEYVKYLIQFKHRGQVLFVQVNRPGNNVARPQFIPYNIQFFFAVGNLAPSFRKVFFFNMFPQMHFFRNRTNSPY
jgi:hypothetical protein